MDVVRARLASKFELSVGVDQLWDKVVGNMRLMLEDRGFEASLVSEGEIRGEKGEEVVSMLLLEEEKLSVKTLRHLTSKYEGIGMILVSLLGPTSFTKKEMAENHPDIEIFLYQDFVVNPVRHSLVPRHTRLTKEEEEDLFRRFGRERNRYPKLPSTDVVSRYYNFRPGDVIGIKRQFGFQEPTIYYRIVS